MLNVVTKLVLFFSSAQVGMGTTFWTHGDRFNPDNSNACHYRAPGVPRFLDDGAMAFAHKTLPCGTRALIVNPRTGKSAYARKWDTGPRRALIDMTKALSKAVGSNGLEPIIVIPQ